MSMNNINNPLQSFLNGYRSCKGDKYNFTSMGKPTGSYFIPVDKYNEFLKSYITTIDTHNIIPHLTQKPDEISPILIDLDFKFDLDNNKRNYEMKDIFDIIEYCFEFISKYFIINEKNGICYIFERDSPYKDRGYTKDGIHIIFPYLHCNKNVKLILRNKLINVFKTTFDSIGVINKIEDIFDLSVITRNNWMVYGSTKPNLKPYKLTQILNKDMQVDKNESWDIEDIVKNTNVFYDKELEIKYINNNSKKDFDKLYDEYEKSMKNIKSKDKPTIKMIQDMASKNFIKKKEKERKEDIEYAPLLINILNQERAENYNNWIELGWCCHNIGNKLLQTWINFSKKSSKFKEGECEKLWETMKPDGLGMGTLIRWARNDNPVEYEKLRRKHIRNYIERASTGTSYHVATVLYHMYRYQYVCVNLKNKNWYEFRNHRWHQSEGGIDLRKKISCDLSKEFLEMSSFYNQKAIEASEDERGGLLNKKKKFDEIAIKLCTTKFKKDILEESMELFMNPQFMNKLDGNRDLIGFNNGVFDLEKYEFRDGRPEDYISLCTETDYIEFNNDDKQVIELYEIIEKIHPKVDMRNYVLSFLSSCLSGFNREQKFQIWEGVGSNGKSLLVDLFEASFGKYCTKLPITLLTGKRSASNAANPELAKTKGRRFCVLQEPEEDEQLNVGLMKELSGGDTIMARPLYHEPIEFKPQFKMVLTCNHLPKITSNDCGTWRRIRVVEFKSQFVDSPDINDINQYKADCELPSRLEEYKEAFMNILIKYYKNYKLNGLDEPDDVKQYTKEYQKNSDFYSEFFSEFLVETNNPKDIVKIDQVYSIFKNWYKECHGISKNSPARKNLKQQMEKRFGNYKNGWKQMKLKLEEDDDIEFIDGNDF